MGRRVFTAILPGVSLPPYLSTINHTLEKKSEKCMCKVMVKIIFDSQVRAHRFLAAHRRFIYFYACICAHENGQCERHESGSSKIPVFFYSLA